jgi:hypothetical protein
MKNHQIQVVKTAQKHQAQDVVGRVFYLYRSFLSRPPALPHIKGLGWTKTRDKTFAVLGGFWHDAA